MKWLFDIFRTPRMRRELREELSSHIEEKISDLVEAGIPEAEARAAALREFGNFAATAEDARSVWGWIWFERLVQDVRLALFQMAKHPGFTAIATLSISLGIGVNAVTFSVLHTVLLQPLPFPESERLVRVLTVPPGHPNYYDHAAVPDYVAWRDQNRVFDLIAAINDVDRDLGAETNGIAAQKVYGQMVSASLFDLTGMRPILGRAFTSDEDQMDKAARVVVISHRLWLARYGGDSGVLGRKLRMDGEPFTIIGVAPRGYNVFNEEADFWAPIPFRHFQLQGASRYIFTVARLKPGVTVRQAQAQMESVANQLAATLPAHAKGWGVRVDPLREAELGGFREPLLIFQMAAALVLLIACANVMGLLLSRSASRRAEVAIRAALGAGRWRIFRQYLTESLMLALVGCVGGIALAREGIRFLVAESPAWLPNLHDIAIDRTVLAFATGLSILTGIMFGAFPSLRAARCDASDFLKTAGRGSSGDFGTQRLRTVLVIAQIALSVVLLAGAGLMIKTFSRLLAVDPGFDTRGLITFRFRLPRDPYVRPTGRTWSGFPLQEVSPAAADTFNRVADRLRAVPGVLSATAVSDPPYSGGLGVDFTIEGRPVVDQTGADNTTATAFFVERAYFQTLRVPMIAGRDFSKFDTAASAPTVIVNEAMAKRYWPNDKPVGQKMTVVLGKDDQPREIVGVVSNMRESHFQALPDPAVYILDTQQPALVRGAYSPHRRLMTFVLRIANDRANVLTAVRRAVAEIAPEVPIGEMRSVDDYAGDELKWRRYYLILLAIFAGIATLLAGIGIYGVIAYSVQARRQEFGVRIALGASGRRIVLMLGRQTILMLLVGLACGLAGASVLTRFIASQLWGVTATDVPTFTAVVCLLTATSFTASWIPVRRVLRLDPNTALRYE